MSLVLDPPQSLVTQSAPSAAPRRGLAGWLTRWRLALRMARRDARRAKARTALVLVMVGVPVLAIVAGDTLFRTNEVSAVEALPGRLGSADARIEGVAREQVYADPTGGDVVQFSGQADPPWTAAEVEAALPAGSEVVEQRVGRIAYRTSIGYATVDAFADDLTRPIRDGAFGVVEGRVPARDGEVAISTAVARRGIGVGDRLQLTRDDVAVTVVGVVRADAEPGMSALVLPPEAADLLDAPRTLFYAAVPGSLDWPEVQELNGLGLAVVSRAVAEDPPPAVEYLPPGYPADSSLDPAMVAVVALIVAALLLEVVLLAGPAFAVGLRRQRHDLALLAASGGTPADLRRAVLASGLLLGAGAAVLGGLLGIGAARVAVPLLEDRFGAGLGPFEVPWRDTVVVVLVGAVAGLAAAAVPARQAARTDVVTTLTGRRGQVRTSWRLPVLGLVVAVAGLVLTILGARGTEVAVAGGAVLLVVGVVIATPWLVGLLVPLGRRLPISGRLAVRDATRNRSRTAPAVAAVMATVAGVTALAIGSASDSAQGRRDYTPTSAIGTAVISIFGADAEGWAAARRAVEQQVPDRAVHTISSPAWTEQDQIQVAVGMPGCSGGAIECGWMPDGLMSYSTTLGQIVVVDRATLLAATPEPMRDEVLRAYRDDAVLIFGRGAVTDDRVTVKASRFDGTVEERLDDVVLPATEVDLPASSSGFVQVPAMAVLPPSLADRLPVSFAPTSLMTGGPDAPVTKDEQSRIDEAIAALSGDYYLYVERGWSDDLWVARLLLVVVGGVLVLVATLTATGLAVADARPDLATLAAVGAAPRTGRLVAMGSAAVIGGFGAVLGVLAGLAPGIAVAYPLTSTDYGLGAHPLVVVPWDLLAAVAVGVPLLAVLVTGLAVRSRLPMATRID